MTKHEFIFSDQPKHRVLRHVTFWIVWWVAFLLLFHYPVHSFKGWNLDKASDSYQKLGVTHFVIKTMVFNTLLAVIVTQILFTYFLIYYILPNYYYKKKNPILTFFILILGLSVHYILSIGFKCTVHYANYFYGLNATLPEARTLIRNSIFPVMRDQLISLPIVASFALMIKIIKHWWLKYQEAEQLFKEKTRAELQLLKAQIHPHFLFNTLNNIYFFTLSGSPKAPVMIKKLRGILYYILNECSHTMVPLEKEIKMIEDYMELEKIRYGEELVMTVELSTNGQGKMIAPLLLIPFVENSFKHGTSKMLSHPYVTLRITIEDNALHFFITNSRPSAAEPASSKGNIGLRNVKKRLQLLYPDDHELTIISEPESFTVYLTIRLQGLHASMANNSELISTPSYELA